MATTLGPDHVYQYVNPSHIKIVGKNFSGISLREAVPEAVKLAELFDRVFSTGVAESNVELPVVINSRTHYMNANYVATRNASGEVSGVIALGIDVTGEVEARRHAEQAVEDLRAERVIRERFVETITHDLRTPMTAARMSAQLLERKADDPQFVKLASKRIIQSVDRSNRMIVDLLDANSIKAGSGVPIKIEYCTMNELITQVVTELSEIYGARFQIADDCGLVQGYWDSVAVQRIIENLVGNAVKYGTPKSVITVALKKKSEGIEISVHNQGNPISEDDQRTIFSPYRRTDHAKSHGQIGWGIGLTLVKGLTEAHFGKVRVESFPETGTTFYVEIPVDSRRVPHE